ncbi:MULTISPECIES: ATP-grasp domain-containing protein [Bacteroides]|uniref:ATP-grasp domain-containing protein n=1 Tax=Bacteroides TaxID=816 RepID=UPI00214AA4EB|nr:ATP-grasp domain-containing protein [Bacteroides acidifaciens]MCR1996578.1 ATP-grasp domain-containing protein [Bacteroides acidifaciens]
MWHNETPICDVMVTYCWNRVGYTIVKNLTKHGLRVIVCDTSTTNICSKSHYAVGSFSYPDPFTEEAAFITVLKKAVETHKPKVLLPTHDESVIIAKHRSEFPKDLVIPVVDADLQLLLADKYQTAMIAKELGIPYPKNIDDISMCDYPIVVKTKVGNSAKGVFFPKTQKEAEILITEYGRENLLISEFIGGCDYSVDIVCSKEQVFASVYQAMVTKTEGGGTTTQRVMVDEPKLIEYAIRFVKYVGYEGVLGFDWRVDKERGKVAFIEINARYTGGLATPVCAGFDIPWIHYCLATKGRYDESVNVKIGVKTKWILGDIITFVTRVCHLNLSWRELKALLNFKFDGFDDYEKGDLKALWGEMVYYFVKLVKNKKLNP